MIYTLHTVCVFHQKKHMYPLSVLFLLACFDSHTTTSVIAEEDLETVAIDPSIVRPERIKARHILIAHKNAYNAQSKLRRTRSEAKELAEKVLRDLQSGADFATLSKQYGNDPTASRGGDLGVFGAHQMMPNFSNRAFQLAENEIGICETIFGYHIVQRLPLQEIVLRQLIIQWKDAHASTVSRSEEEAKIRAEEAYAKLEAGSNPIELIKEYSDGSMGSRGGLVGFVEKEKLGKAIQDAAFSLQVGEYTPLLKSSLGYHILFREE